jgi:DNA-binding response OmpR family regulator
VLGDNGEDAPAGTPPDLGSAHRRGRDPMNRSRDLHRSLHDDVDIEIDLIDIRGPEGCPVSSSSDGRATMVGVPMQVLMIEDDDRIRETTSLLLEDEGYEVVGVASAEEGLERYKDGTTACVIVDLMLPGMDGFACCRELRRRSDVPIIMLTARTDPFDVVAGLEAGADDYVTKPFHAKELSARLRALLRRVTPMSARAPTDGSPDATFEIGALSIRPDEGVVLRAGETVALTKTEFRLLCEMAEHPGRVFSREVLLDRVWGYSYVGDGKLVDAHIHRLRAKVEDDPSNPRHVLTVRGLGYKVTR